MKSIDREFLHAVLADCFDPVLAADLVERGADINYLPELDDGEVDATPLMQAAGGGYLEAVSFMLALPGIDINKTEYTDHHNALMYAYMKEPDNLEDIAKTLMRAGIDLAHRDSEKWTIETFEDKLSWKTPAFGKKLKNVREEFMAQAIAIVCVNAKTSSACRIRKLTPRTGSGSVQ